MRTPLRNPPRDANAYTRPKQVLRWTPNWFCASPAMVLLQRSVHNVASGPLEEALAASISPMSNRSFTWTSSLPPEAYLLGAHWGGNPPSDLVNMVEDYQFIHFVIGSHCNISLGDPEDDIDDPEDNFPGLSVAEWEQLYQCPLLCRIVQAYILNYNWDLVDLRILLDISWDELRAAICTLRPFTGAICTLPPFTGYDEAKLVALLKCMARHLLSDASRPGSNHPDSGHDTTAGADIRDFVPLESNKYSMIDACTPQHYHNVLQWLKAKIPQLLDLQTSSVDELMAQAGSLTVTKPEAGRRRMVWLEGVGGGVPLEVVETDEREENEQESEERRSHPRRAACSEFTTPAPAPSNPSSFHPRPHYLPRSSPESVRTTIGLAQQRLGCVLIGRAATASLILVFSADRMQRAPPSVRGQQSRRPLNNAKRAVMARAESETGSIVPPAADEPRCRLLSQRTSLHLHPHPRSVRRQRERGEGKAGESCTRSVVSSRAPLHLHKVHDPYAGSEAADSMTHLASRAERGRRADRRTRSDDRGAGCKGTGARRGRRANLGSTFAPADEPPRQRGTGEDDDGDDGYDGYAGRENADSLMPRSGAKV
ncbi:hypothetical protein B0H13DRAFT_2335683 [Mycena leptocephala]|nr:hypothetical protein B0H13DRAFT_2335683 [Mycena leptocephala]